MTGWLITHAPSALVQTLAGLAIGGVVTYVGAGWLWRRMYRKYPLP
jgi:hypothetical protein